MARPLKSGLDYFPHDVAARMDEKIAAMRHLYGNDGYAFYFIILERSYSGQNSGISLKDKTIRTIIRKEIGVDAGLFDEMIATACKIGLFDPKAWENEQILTSQRIKEQYQAVEKERKRKRRNYRNKSGETPEKPDKVKKRKVKQNPPTPQGGDEGGEDYSNFSP